MITEKELQEMRMIKLCDIDQDALVDIRSVKINKALSKEERILDFIAQIKNPFLFKCGDMVIQSKFSETDITLTDRLKQYLKNG